MTVVANLAAPATVAARIPRTAVVSGSELRFACAHLLRRLAEGMPSGHRAPEVIEAPPGRAIPSSADLPLQRELDLFVSITMPSGVQVVGSGATCRAPVFQTDWSKDELPISR